MNNIHHEQSNFAFKLKNLDQIKVKNNLKIVLNNFTSWSFSVKDIDKTWTTRELTPEIGRGATKLKKSKLKLQKKIMNEIKADEKEKNDEIFPNYLKYQNPSFLAKDLVRGKQAINEQLVNILMMNWLKRKFLKIIRRPSVLATLIKILTSKQILQRLPLALA